MAASAVRFRIWPFVSSMILWTLVTATVACLEIRYLAPPIKHLNATFAAGVTGVGVCMSVPFALAGSGHREISWPASFGALLGVWLAVLGILYF